jgi:Uncharacterised protein conserved in bacteria (DUF2336)
MPNGDESASMPVKKGAKTPHSRLAEDLVKLASEPTSEKRVELLRRITDAYVDLPDQPSSAEKYFFEDVVTKLIDKIEDSHRVAAAERLAKLPDLPNALAGKLASDQNIDVARPIIRDHRGLSERVLVDVAKSGSQDHLNVIAGRSNITPPVTDVVVERGDSKTVRTLAANSGAQFSPQGMDNLIGKAKADSDLQALIVARDDLTVGAISKLLPMISDKLAWRLRGAAVDVDLASIRAHLGEWAEDRKENIKRTDAYIERIRKNDLTLDDVVLDLVKAKRLFDSAAVIGAMTELNRFYIFYILTVGKIESTLLMMRSVNLSWRAADAFLRLRAAKAGIGEFGTLPTRLEYEAIDVPAAQRVVRFMKVRRVAAS